MLCFSSVLVYIIGHTRISRISILDSVRTPSFTWAELALVMQQLKAKNTTPGPDSILGRAWVLALDDKAPALLPRLRGLFSACLKQDQFHQWKTGKLILIREKGRPADSRFAYRFLVLLDEVCKLFETVISWHLVKRVFRIVPDLGDKQYGFHQSTLPWI